MIMNRVLKTIVENTGGKKRISEVPVPHGDLIDIDSKITIGVKTG